MTICFNTDLSSVGLINRKELAALSAAGMATVRDLLEFFPKRHEDRRLFRAFPSVPSDEPVCLRGIVVDTRKQRFGRGGGVFHAVLMDGSGGVFGSGKITCRWFNMPYMNQLVACGHELILYGKVKDQGGVLVIDHPEFEILKADDAQSDSVHVDRIVPIYRGLSGMPARRIRELIHHLLQTCDRESCSLAVDVDPMQSRADALRDVHFPQTDGQAEQARRRFALEEFFIMQLNVLWRKVAHKNHEGRVLGKKTRLLSSFYHSLPFDLTGAQKRSIREIISDMRRPAPMNRLLQGDVGAGKTFVAIAAMLLAVDSGCQAALMAPTQILAEQHFLTFCRWLEPLALRIQLRTADHCESNRPEDAGPPDIVIGTHALLYDAGEFTDLGMVVIDEQHKFGVSQRMALIGRGRMPDVLVMTATPIPRTLTMTVYGDLDVSILDEKPPGRGRVVTALRKDYKQTDLNRFVKERLTEGQQAYLIYPLVEESENLRMESAVEAYPKWCKRLKGFDVGLMHGRLSADEKEDVMKQFRDGQIQALVATSVIEVGVDVPQASVMLLHHAERFGLAQLHQLRGRIGRGSEKSYCILLTDSKNPEALHKLQVLERTRDGFEIAEADLRMRGPGDVLGTRQSGLADLKFADFLADTPLLIESRRLAEQVFLEDPHLDGTHQALRGLLTDGSPDRLIY
ncbi:MAG: ATP-dependent DNA helicase RecG [Luteolibacter sp.]